MHEDPILGKAALMILITNARGKTGRRVANTLKASKHRIREGSSQTVPPFSLGAPETWAAALEDVSAVYLVPAAGEHPVDAKQIDAFVQQATSSGVERVVLLSARGEGEGGEEPTMRQIEHAVRAQAKHWTILRPAWFAQNFTEGMFAAAVDAGALRLPAGCGKEAFVDLDDVAEVAALALTTDAHDEATYVLTGPATLSFAEAAEEITARTRATVTYQAVSADELASEHAALGVPAEATQLLVQLLRPISEGKSDRISADIESVLGRPARSFARFVERAVQHGVWAPVNASTD